MSKKKVVIMLPIHRHMEDLTWEKLLATIKSSEHDIGYYKKIGDSLISRARNELGRLFLNSKEKYDYLMFIDDDITWDANQKPIDKLIASNKDIIAGVYPVRDGSFRPAIRTKKIQSLVNKGKYNGEKVNVVRNKVYEVVYASTGFMLISRKCLESIYDKYKFPFAPFGDENDEYLSEDWAFCKRARDLNFKVWVDTTIKLGHIGMCIYTIDGVQTFT